MPQKKHHHPGTIETVSLAREHAALDSDSPRPLMSKPQPLGILPSFWFWHDLWRTDPMLGQFFVLLCALMHAPFVYIFIVYLPPSWLPVGLMGLTYVLSMGLVEKWLRFRVTRRRRLTLARQHDLPGLPPSPRPTRASIRVPDKR